MSREIFTDGSGWNRKVSKIMITFDNGEFIEKEFTDRLTSVEVEYIAVIEALKLSKPGDIIYNDNKVVVKQIQDLWACRQKHLFKYYIQGKKLFKEKGVKLKWIPREKNLAGRLLGR